MTEPEVIVVPTPDGRIHGVMLGAGPTVLMVHGNPGLAYSWRHQMRPLAAAGYRAVAIDCLGYGRSDRPSSLEAYHADAVQRQLLAVLDHLAVDRVIIVGQDFGAQYSWNLAVRAPGRVAAIAACVPYDFDLAGRALQGSAAGGGDDVAAMASSRTPPSVRFAEMARHHFVHVHYYQAVGPAERELGPRLREYLARIFHALSAAGDLLGWAAHPSAGTGYLDVLAPAPPLPWRWLSQGEFDHYVAEYGRLGPDRALVGPLAAYRVADRNWEIGRAWADHDVVQPALFVCGVADPVLALIGDDWRAKLKHRVPGLVDPVIIPQAGHLVQQEQPAAFNAALLGFLAGLGGCLAG